MVQGLDDRRRLILFSCQAPDADVVELSGAFEEADGPIPMRRNGRGEWTTSLDLRPGCYEYRFIIHRQGCRRQAATVGRCSGPPRSDCVASNRIALVT